MDIQKIKISERDRIILSSFMGEDYPIEIDYNWLMPVVEKIENMSLGDVYIDKEPYYNASVCFVIEYHSCRVDLYGSMNLYKGLFSNCDGKLKSLLLVVIEFIKYYHAIDYQNHVNMIDK